MSAHTRRYRKTTDRKSRRFTDHGLELTHQFSSECGSDPWHRGDRSAKDLEEHVIASFLIGLSVSFHYLQGFQHTLTVARRYDRRTDAFPVSIKLGSLAHSKYIAFTWPRASFLSAVARQATHKFRLLGGINQLRDKRLDRSPISSWTISDLFRQLSSAIALHIMNLPSE